MKQLVKFFLASTLVLCGIFTSFSQIKTRSNRDILFAVQVNDMNRAVITWVTGEGHKPARFIVQRSKDNDTFFDIREIPVKANQAEDQRLQFTFTDSKVLRSIEFYRIVEYEEDGKYHVYDYMAAKPTNPITVTKVNDKMVINVLVDDNTKVVPLLGTETGLGIPCDFELGAGNSIVVSPSYSLNGGNYVVKLRMTGGGEKQLKFMVKNDDMFGN